MYRIHNPLVAFYKNIKITEMLLYYSRERLRRDSLTFQDVAVWDESILPDIRPFLVAYTLRGEN